MNISEKLDALQNKTVSLSIVTMLFVLNPIFYYLGLPYADVLTKVFVISLFALSFDMLLGYTGLLNFGQTLFFGMGAYMTAYSLNWLGLNYIIALVLSTLVGAGLGVVLSFLVKRSFKGIPFTFFSLAFGMIVLSMYQKRAFESISGGEGGIIISSPEMLRSMWMLRFFQIAVFAVIIGLLIISVYKKIQDKSENTQIAILIPLVVILGFFFYLMFGNLTNLESLPSYERMTPVRYYLSLSILIGVYFIAKRIVSSPVGSVWKSIRENETRTSVLGYKPFNYKLLAVVISGAIAGLAGGIYVPYLLTVSAGNVFDPFITIRALIFAVLGGLGTLKGAILGAAIIILIEHFLNPIIGPWTNILVGILFIAVVFTMPRGIIGKWTSQDTKSIKETIKNIVK